MSEEKLDLRQIGARSMFCKGVNEYIIERFCTRLAAEGKLVEVQIDGVTDWIPTRKEMEKNLSGSKHKDRILKEYDELVERSDTNGIQGKSVPVSEGYDTEDAEV